jgi:hypothetical protein
MEKVKLFQLSVLPNRTNFIATNDLSQNSTNATKQECALRYKIEQLHWELKQGLFDHYMTQKLAKPSIQFTFA